MRPSGRLRNEGVVSGWTEQQQRKAMSTSIRRRPPNSEQRDDGVAIVTIGTDGTRPRIGPAPSPPIGRRFPARRSRWVGISADHFRSPVAKLELVQYGPMMESAAA